MVFFAAKKDPIERFFRLQGLSLLFCLTILFKILHSGLKQLHILLSVDIHCHRASFSHRCIHHNTAASCCKESASAIPNLCPGPCLFHHFAKHISPVFVRCDKITFFARTRELFSKKLLYFSVKSVILYPTGASVGYKVKRRAFLSGTPVVHPSIIMLFSSFTFLSFTLS